LYIFGGYNSVLGSHYNDLYEFNPLTLSWRSVKTRGIGKPVPRRRQCCLVINNRMYMFGGTSPISTSTIPNNLNEIQDIDGIRSRLYDQSDLYVFDFGIFILNIRKFFLKFSFFFFSSDFKNFMFTFSCPTKN
jgi:N-acetylneuraminic acid mutarotase